MTCPDLKVAPSFDYVPKAPYYMLLGKEIGGPEPLHPMDEPFDKIDGLLETFVARGLPPNRTRRYAVICDRYGVVVVGWHYPVGQPFAPPEWFGVASGYRAVAEFGVMDALDLSLAEIEAEARIGT